MDIAQLSMDMASSSLIRDVSTAMLDMTLDTFENQGATMTEMLSDDLTVHDVNPSVGGNIDIGV